MTIAPKYWIFANHAVGEYSDSDWDTSTILERKKYYFKKSEKNRARINKGDMFIFREYGSGFWGTGKISAPWVEDPESTDKHSFPAGGFPISSIKRWRITLPYEVIRSELSNKNHRLRIASATERDFDSIALGARLFRNLGYGATDGEFLLLESGIEEAVKKNIGKIGLKLADKSIRQQCSLDIGVGRTDLICLDENDNYVVLEFKAVQASDAVVGQVLRYMGYIRENWANAEGREVKGIVLAPSFDEGLRFAAAEAGIKVLRVRIG